MKEILAVIGGCLVAFWGLVICWFAISWCWELVYRRLKTHRAIRELTATRSLAHHWREWV